MASVETVLSENATLNLEENRGQIAIGNYIVQIGSVHGGVVNIAMPGQEPQLRPYPTPVLLRPRRFVGLLDRKTEVEVAATALTAQQPTEFYGRAGSGKTSLLRHLLYDLPLESFPDGVVYLPVRSQPGEDLIQALIDAFFESDSSVKLTEVQARHALQPRKALIALDDVQLTRLDVERLLDSAPNCAFLLASLDRHLWAEGRVVALPGLPPEDALTLMERELGRVLTVEERAGALTLCRRLNGHPLHLLQVVALAQSEGLSLTEVANRLPPENADQTLADQIIGTLSDPEKRVLAILATLVDRVPLPAEHLAALTGLSDPEPVVESLLQRGLIQAHSPRYSLTDNLAQVLEKSWDLRPVRSRILSYFATWAEQSQQAAEDLGEAAEPILQVLTWGVRDGRWREVARLGRAIEGTLALEKRWGAWAQVLQATLQAAEAGGDQVALGWSLHQLGSRALCLADFSLARTQLSRALQLREMLGDRAGAAITRHNLNLLPPLPPQSSNGNQTPPDATPSAEISTWPAWTPIALWSGVIIGLAGLLLGLGLLRAQNNPPPPTPNLGIVFVTVTPGSVAFLPATASPSPTPPPPPSSTATLPPPTETPTPSPTLTPLPPACQPPSNWVTYATQPGDTPDSLAFRANITVFQLQEGNCLPSFNLQPGQIIYLPHLPIPVTSTNTPTPTPTWTPTPTLTPTPTRTPQPVLAVSPDRLLFEPVPVGNSSPPQPLTFSNVGAGSLVITEVSLAGLNPDQFSLGGENCRGRRLTQNQTCRVELTFKPTIDGPRTATLLASDDSRPDPLRVPLRGQGLALNQPDLVIIDLRVVTDVVQISQELPQIVLPLAVVIQNQGQAEAGTFTSLICEGQDDSCANARFRLFFDTTTPLAPGEMVTFSGIGQLPPELAGQRIFVNAKADSCVGFEGNPAICRVAESNENNNGFVLPVQLPRTDTPPQVEITDPADEVSLQATDFDQEQGVAWVNVTLQGRATDAEDGPLPDAALFWTTDQSELQSVELGSGSKIDVQLYTFLCDVTSHTITLAATDRDGNESVATRGITVRDFCVE